MKTTENKFGKEIWITGESGSGKSLMANQFKYAFEAEGKKVFHCECRSAQQHSYTKAQIKQLKPDVIIHERITGLLTLMALLLTLSSCVNPYCGDMQNKRVDSATFDQCINTAMMVPGRMGIVPAPEIDACALKAAQFTKKMCGM